LLEVEKLRPMSSPQKHCLAWCSSLNVASASFPVHQGIAYTYRDLALVVQACT